MHGTVVYTSRDHRFPLLFRGILPALAAISMALAPSALAQGDPGTIYLDAYLMVEDAEKLEGEGQHPGALRKYLDAKLILDTIARDYPQWRPEVLAFRRKKVNEAIGRCRAHVPGAEQGVPKRFERVPQQPYVPPAGAPTGASLLEEKDSRIRQLENENERLLAGVQATQARMEATAQKLRTVQTAQASLLRDLQKARQQLDSSNNDPELVRGLETQIERLTGELAIANEALQKANAQNGSLQADLQRAEDTISSLKTERDELRRERERMEELLKGSEEGDVKELIAANIELKKELDEARRQARELAAGKERDEAKISALRERLAGVERRLAELQQENADYEERITSLAAKLRETESNLERALQAGAEQSGGLTKSALEENRALRDILKRQLMQQSYRKQTKQLVLAELQRRGVTSRELIGQIEALAGNGLQLTDSERELLSESLLNELGGGTILQPGRELPPAEYPELAGHNNGELGAAGLNDNLTEYARAIALDFAAGNFEACESAYRRILQIAPDNVYALRNLGIVAMRSGENKEAEEAFLSAIEHGPSDGYSHFLLGVFYYRNGLDDLAMRSIDRGLFHSPDNAKAHHYLGAMCIKRGMRERARQEFQSVIAIDPTFGDAYFNLAYLYVTDTPPRLDLAREFYLRAQKNGTEEDAAMNRALGT